MTEIQEKSVLVRVSARFELARVLVTGSRLYVVLFVTICREEQDIFLWNFYFLLVIMKLLLTTK